VAWRPRRAIVAALLAVAAIALLQVVLFSTFTHTGQQLQTLQARRDELKAEIYRTEADVAALASLDRTERIARERLGMVPAKVSNYVTVDVQAPSGALLPRPLTRTDTQNETATKSESWWKSLLKALPLP
jgi:cell division protein FtsL